MGAITQAMAAECTARGVVLRTSAPVARVIVEGGIARPASSSTSGEVIEAARVVANVNPKLLFQQLVAPEHVPEDFRARIEGVSLRFRHVPHESSRSLRLPELYRAARRGRRSRIIEAASSWRRRSRTWSARTSMRARDGWSRAPIVEMLIPSTVDDSLAPPGKHVASLFCQHVHPDLSAGACPAAPGTMRARKSRT